jgi:hypothetical protein
MTERFTVRHASRGNYVSCALFAGDNALGVPRHLGDLLMSADIFRAFQAACPGLQFEERQERRIGERK